ncbi:uncharacterized protein LOC124113268 [Haliotis rufescens]|uniref:uncharacterized protein LOC124113268 n=1 Tax=Haliotis rufescens TaxID=6454 RepID=UPI00201E77DE|nr:uncharacterized protein LOC124113268 [Haliotis rufescens]XP_046329511.2 uncharacterized protein LOC124113268 [Haliotis rufescens]XP_046329512.2 uncharacterized protein LOC124113268 [Haliotis rufescens]
MMRSLSVLGVSLVLVCALVSSAPVEKAPELAAGENIEVAKRDQEAILFGNQQNDPRLKKKKSDPAVPVIADDSSLDKQGSVIAVPAKQEDFIPEEHQVAGSAQEQTAVEADDNQEQEQVAPVVPVITQQLPEGPVGDAGSEVDADSVEEELKDILADSNEGEGPVGAPVDDVPAEEEEVESEEEGEGAEQTDDSEGTAVAQADNDVNTPLLDLYYYMRENEKGRNNDPPQQDYYPYDLSYYPYRRRRSSRRSRAITEGDMIHNEVKRSKRIKRDLLDDIDAYSYGDEEGYPQQLTAEDLYELYRPEPRYEDEVATLLDMYQQAPQVAAYEPYERYPVEESYPETYEEVEQQEEPEYVPSKRQMMSNLPGIRKRYFYPFSREPQTHWGAFIPQQKRDYEQAYKRLLALASALSEDSPYYEEYRKK